MKAIQRLCVLIYPGLRCLHLRILLSAASEPEGRAEGLVTGEVGSCVQDGGYKARATLLRSDLLGAQAVASSCTV